MELENWIWPAMSLVIMGLAFIIIYVIVKVHFVERERLRYAELVNNKMKTYFPLKLKAYERLIFFVERMSPQNLIHRVNRGSMTSAQLQLELLRAIREEFEHNVSMQMYVSDQSWQLVAATREEVSQWIREAASKVGPKASGLELSQHILQLESKKQTNLSKLAIASLKKELREDLN
jgi:hypothetical protein